MTATNNQQSANKLIIPYAVQYVATIMDDWTRASTSGHIVSHTRLSFGGKLRLISGPGEDRRLSELGTQ